MGQLDPMIHDINKLVHKYGLQEVRGVIEVRYQQMMKDVRAFASETGIADVVRYGASLPPRRNWVFPALEDEGQDRIGGKSDD